MLGIVVDIRRLAGYMRTGEIWMIRAITAVSGNRTIGSVEFVRCSTSGISSLLVSLGRRTGIRCNATPSDGCLLMKQLESVWICFTSNLLLVTLR